MKRNQYKLLAEKYQSIQENDKEDVLTGLEELEYNPEEPITKDNVKKLGFEPSKEHGVRNFYTIPGDDSKIGLKCDYYIQAGEVWNLVDGLNIRKYYVHTLGDLQNKYNKIKTLNAGHQVVQEDDKEDIMAGLEELGDIPQVIYGIDTEMCRGEYDRGETREWGPDKIYEIYFEDEDAVNYYSDFTSDFRPYTFEAFIDKIKTGGVVTISGEETAESFCINKERLEKEIDDWEKENGYEEELDESDKEDIVAGLEELETGRFPPKEKVSYVLQKMEYDGLWPDYAVKLHGVIPSTARKVFDGVYIDTAPAVNKKYTDSPGTDEKGFYTLYITRPDYMELFIKYNNGDYNNPEVRDMWQHIYSALEMTGVSDPVLPT